MVCLGGGLKVDLMFWGSRAPWGRSEDRCDGAGSEADGAKPPVKPGHKLPVLGVLVLWKICFGEAPEQRSSDILKRVDRRAGFARRSICRCWLRCCPVLSMFLSTTS